MAKPYVSANEIENTLASDYVHGTDNHAHLTSAAGFPTGGGYIRIGNETSFCLCEYTAVSTNDLTGVIPCTLGVVVSVGDETKTWPATTEVSLVDAAEMYTAANLPLHTQAVANGGTGLTGGTDGGVLAFTAAGTLASSALLTQYGVLVGGGAGVAPSAIAASTTTTQALFATATAPAFRAVAAGDLPTTLTPAISQYSTALANDHTYWGDVVSENVGEAVAFGELLYFDCSEVEWKKADYNATGTMPCTGMALEAKNDGEACKILKWGGVRHDAWSWAVADAADTKTLYVGAAGAMQVAPVTGTGDFSQAVAIVKTATTIDFNPSLAMAVHL